MSITIFFSSHILISALLFELKQYSCSVFCLMVYFLKAKYNALKIMLFP